MNNGVSSAMVEEKETEWFFVCQLQDVFLGTGAAARLGNRQVAVFNTREGVFAIDNLDPFSQANVLSRGVIGDIGGRLVVASPVYKQHFCLRTGECLEDDSASVTAYQVDVRDDKIYIGVAD